ncbi:hypothetical protein J6590_017970 [Homalodisca vitripennis]|nr:hypothetical protein J6590_017970 [Homalodisca vitripennis]
MRNKAHSNSKPPKWDDDDPECDSSQSRLTFPQRKVKRDRVNPPVDRRRGAVTVIVTSRIR